VFELVSIIHYVCGIKLISIICYVCVVQLILIMCYVCVVEAPTGGARGSNWCSWGPHKILLGSNLEKLT
jgi:hypothetical protein